MKKLLSVGILLLLTLGLTGQSLTPVGQQARKVYSSYLMGSEDSWIQAVKELQSIYEKSEQSNMECLLQLTTAQYGLIGYQISLEEEEGVDELIESAFEHAETLADKSLYASEGYALMAGITAMKISLSPIKAVFLGRKSEKYVQKAESLNPQNPTAWIERANMKYHAPRAFGGDKEASIYYYQTAIDLFEANSSKYSNNWLYLYAYVSLAKAYEATGQVGMAIAIYQKVLEIAPNFERVERELLPSVKEG